MIFFLSIFLPHSLRLFSDSLSLVSCFPPIYYLSSLFIPVFFLFSYNYLISPLAILFNLPPNFLFRSRRGEVFIDLLLYFEFRGPIPGSGGVPQGRGTLHTHTRPLSSTGCEWGMDCLGRWRASWVHGLVHCRQMKTMQISDASACVL